MYLGNLNSLKLIPQWAAELPMAKAILGVFDRLFDEAEGRFLTLPMEADHIALMMLKDAELDALADDLYLSAIVYSDMQDYEKVEIIEANIQNRLRLGTQRALFDALAGIYGTSHVEVYISKTPGEEFHYMIWIHNPQKHSEVEYERASAAIRYAARASSYRERFMLDVEADARLPVHCHARVSHRARIFIEG